MAAPASALIRDPADVRPDQIELTGIQAFGYHGVYPVSGSKVSGSSWI